MKIKIEDLGETYEDCTDKNIIKEKDDVDIELIKSLMDSAGRAKARIKKDKIAYEEETKDWTFLFRDRYEILRTLIDAFLLFDKIKADNHQCSNAYLCTKHSELEFDWNILEAMRILRNGINYEGKAVDLDKWNKFKLQFAVYTSTLTKEIEKKLKTF